jgi:hypothetical protein
MLEKSIKLSIIADCVDKFVIFYQIWCEVKTRRPWKLRSVRYDACRKSRVNGIKTMMIKSSIIAVKQILRFVRSEARQRVAKVHRLRNKWKATVCRNSEHWVGWRTKQRHEKDSAATSSFTDEEERDKDRRKALLTTPEDASVRKRFVVRKEEPTRLASNRN